MSHKAPKCHWMAAVTAVPLLTADKPGACELQLCPEHPWDGLLLLQTLQGETETLPQSTKAVTHIKTEQRPVSPDKNCAQKSRAKPAPEHGKFVKHCPQI